MTLVPTAQASRSYEPVDDLDSLDDLVCAHMPVARAIARRFRNRGLDSDDLEQVAYLALVYAAHRYDATKGDDFLAYAGPTIRGQLKKHFRDKGWTVRPPRHIQELQPQVTAARAELGQALGRSPRPDEVAEHLDVHVETVLEALGAVGCFAPSSLDAPTRADPTTTTGDLLRSADEREGGGSIDVWLTLAPALRRLEPRARRIVYLRFFEERTQAEIGEDVGVSQMHVSRLLAEILRDLREQLGSDAAPGG